MIEVGGNLEIEIWVKDKLSAFAGRFFVEKWKIKEYDKYSYEYRKGKSQMPAPEPKRNEREEHKRRRKRCYERRVHLRAKGRIKGGKPTPPKSGEK